MECKTGRRYVGKLVHWRHMHDGSSRRVGVGKPDLIGISRIAYYLIDSVFQKNAFHFKAIKAKSHVYWRVQLALGSAVCLMRLNDVQRCDTVVMKWAITVWDFPREMEWENKFSSIVRETETNLARVRVSSCSRLSFRSTNGHTLFPSRQVLK